MAIARRLSCLLLVLATISLSAAQSVTFVSHHATVQPGNSNNTDEFVNQQEATTQATNSNSQTTTLSAATTTGETSSQTDNSRVTASATTPVLMAAVAACVVAIAAIVVVKKRANKRLPSPHTPLDKDIYLTGPQKKPHFHGKRERASTDIIL